MKFIRHLFVFLIFFLGNNNGWTQNRFFHLVWNDEFDSDMIDTSKWSFQVGNGCPSLCGWGNNELEFYTEGRKENARIENGCLVIEARKEACTDTGYTSARMLTKGKGDWKYGRFEIRAKIPSGRGLWPAVWMMPTENKYGTWPHSGEIDIMENVGYIPDSLFGTAHTGAFNGMIGTQKTGSVFRNNIASDFHTYSIEWDESQILFFLDGMQYHEFKNVKGDSETWPFDQHFHLIMNIAVGGYWGGKYGVDDAVFPQRMLVDFVRVYQ